MGFRKKVEDESLEYYSAKKDKLLEYIYAPRHKYLAVHVNISKTEYAVLKEFHTLTQFISSFTKAKLVF